MLFIYFIIASKPLHVLWVFFVCVALRADLLSVFLPRDALQARYYATSTSVVYVRLFVFNARGVTSVKITKRIKMSGYLISRSFSFSYQTTAKF